MAGTFSDYLENKVLDHAFSTTAFTMPTDARIALGTASSDSSFTEISGTGYSRQSIAFGAASAGAISNSGELNLGTASGDWNTGLAITHFCIFDQGTNQLAQGTLDASKSVLDGDTAKFPVGSIVITLT